MFIDIVVRIIWESVSKSGKNKCIL